MLLDRINERSKGAINIEYLGGPEVISSFNQPKAVREGSVDMAQTIASFYQSVVPASNTILLSELTPQEERQRGVNAYLEDLHEKAGLFYLGRGRIVRDPELFLYLFTNKKIQTPYDLPGQIMSTKVLTRFLKALGVAPANIPDPELYGAMDRGVLDGYMVPMPRIYGLGLHEVTKYGIDQAFYKPSIVTVMNLDKWNEIPTDLQKMIVEIQIELEEEWGELYITLANEQKNKLIAAGMEFIEFSPSDAKWFLDTAYKVEWDYYLNEFPEVAPILKEMLSK